jgi:S-adenosylmethionine synthetase
VKEATVYLLSQIGAPLDQPLVATAQVRPVNGALTPTIQEDVQAVIDERLANVSDIRVCILNCEQSLF